MNLFRRAIRWFDVGMMVFLVTFVLFVVFLIYLHKISPPGKSLMEDGLFLPALLFLGLSFVVCMFGVCGAGAKSLLALKHNLGLNDPDTVAWWDELTPGERERVNTIIDAHIKI